MAKHWWSSSSGKLELQLTEEEIAQGSHQGDCEADINALLGRPFIAQQVAEWDAEMLRDELREYGAWDETELADHDMNLVRMVWNACNDLREELA